MTWPSPKARKAAAKRRAEREAHPSLAKPCQCERPVPIPPEDGLGPRCHSCGKALP